MVLMATAEMNISKKQTSSFIRSIWGVPISDGTICNIEARATAVFEEAYSELLESVRSSKSAKYVDETTWRGQL